MPKWIVCICNKNIFTREKYIFKKGLFSVLLWEMHVIHKKFQHTWVISEIFFYFHCEVNTQYVEYIWFRKMYINISFKYCELSGKNTIKIFVIYQYFVKAKFGFFNQFILLEVPCRKNTGSWLFFNMFFSDHLVSSSPVNMN